MKYDYLATTLATRVEIHVEKSLFFSLVISSLLYHLKDHKNPKFFNSVVPYATRETGNWGKKEEVLPNYLLSYRNLLIQMKSKPLVPHSLQEKP